MQRSLNPKLQESIRPPLEQVRESDFNLSPSLFVEVTEDATHRPLRDIVSDLKAAAEERERADEALSVLLRELHLD